MCSRSGTRSYRSDFGARLCQTQEQEDEGSDLKGSERSRGSEYLVGPEKSAGLADRGMLRAKNSAIAQRQESSRDRRNDAGLTALRSVRPFGETPPASEALGNPRENGRSLGGS